MTIITKGMGAILKAKMKKAGVTKPTFPGPRATDLLNEAVKKSKARGADKFELSLGRRKHTRKNRPGASALELSERIDRNK
tara:strand:+ start:75 stop:317 length:243 start_codon:yes stop_codon:yes gene_type:complete